MLNSTAVVSSIAMLALLALPATALASDPSSRPATWDMSPEQLRAVGLGQTRAAPIPVPRDKHADTAPKAIKQGLLFVNFEAITLTMGNDDSRTDVSSIFAGEFVAFGGGDAERAAVMAAVRTDWEPYDLVITESRPAAGDYTMNVTSPTNPFGSGSGVLGIAPLDCMDMMAPNNVTFAFHGAGDGFSPATVATTIGQEVAHSYGLEHVNNPADIMNPQNSGGDPTFRDECIAIVDGGAGIFCPDQHATHCGEPTMQNSHLELLEIFGSSIPDTQAPLVRITTPNDGAEYEVGANFRIEVTVTDDNAVASVQLFDGETSLMQDTSEPYGWDVVQIPEGVYEFTVKATDPSTNEAISDVVTVYVGLPAPEPESDGTGTGGTDSAGQDGDGDDGCGCRQSPQDNHHVLGLGLTVLGLAARRRGRPRPKA